MNTIFKAIEAYEKKAKMLAHSLVLDRLEISKALREERVKKRVSLREMARRLKVSAAYLSDVELGKRNISTNLYEKLKKL